MTICYIIVISWLAFIAFRWASALYHIKREYAKWLRVKPSEPVPNVYIVEEISFPYHDDHSKVTTKEFNKRLHWQNIYKG